MKATELRIGNKVINEDKVVTVDGIQNHWIWTIENPSNAVYKFSPISLTEEWLVKFGFEKRNNPNEYVCYISIDNRQLCWCISSVVSLEFKIGQNDEFNDTIMDISCEYVHQLQNLYFALTGRELNLIKNI